MQCLLMGAHKFTNFLTCSSLFWRLAWAGFVMRQTNFWFRLFLFMSRRILMNLSTSSSQILNTLNIDFITCSAMPNIEIMHFVKFSVWNSILILLPFLHYPLVFYSTLSLHTTTPHPTPINPSPQLPCNFSV